MTGVIRELKKEPLSLKKSLVSRAVRERKVRMGFAFMGRGRFPGWCVVAGLFTGVYSVVSAEEGVGKESPV